MKRSTNHLVRKHHSRHEKGELFHGKLTVLALLVTEVLGNGKTSESDTGTGTGGLVHLTEHKRDLRLALELNDGGLLHFVVQIVTLTGTLTDTGEHGETTVSLGDVVDKLLNEHGLADTGTTEETNLSTTGIGSEQIDDLDTGDENLGGGRLLDELGSLAVNGPRLLGLNGATLVDRVTSDVHDTAESGGADGDGDGSTGVERLGATDETLGTYLKSAASRANFFLSLPGLRHVDGKTYRPWQCSGRHSHRDVAAMELVKLN